MAFTIAASWNTGDINTRSTQALGIIDKAHDGTPYILAPVQHGVKCFSPSGTLQWTYNSITNGYDVRDIAVGDLNGTGYSDCCVICSGYYTTGTDGKAAIVDKDGNALQLLLGSAFATASVARVYAAAVSGTDIYLGHDLGVTRFTKSGTWSEDTSGWNKSIGVVRNIQIADAGNGTRIFVMTQAGKLYCYQSDGTQDWAWTIGSSYTCPFVIAKTDSSKTGLQIVAAKQAGVLVADKDGALSATITTGTNVRGGVIAYDCDGDGEAEIYYTDMGRDIWCFERTGTDTYSQKYTITDLLTSTSVYAGMAHYDLDDDGADEIFIYTTDGHLYIYDKTLATQHYDLTLGHGQAGGFFLSYAFKQNGVAFEDTNGDGSADIIIAGATGYIDVYATTVSGGAAYGSLAVPLTLAVGTVGTVTARAAATLPLTLTVVAAGAATVYASATVVVTVDYATDAYRVQAASVTADSVDGAWTDQAGGTDLEAAIDESAYSDADFIRSEQSPALSACRLKLGTLPDPTVSKGHSIHWRIAKSSVGEQVDMTVTLYEGGADVLGAGTEIASFVRTNVGTDFATYVETLSGAQAAVITDYSDLFIELEANAP